MVEVIADTHWLYKRDRTDLIKQLLAGGAGLDGKFQLSVHSGDANIDLWKQKRKVVEKLTKAADRQRTKIR